MKLRYLPKVTLPVWILLVFVIVFFVRIPSFFEPYYYGDEMIYLVLGQGIREGLTLYKDIHDNKPPLLYFVAALAGNVFWFRAILASWMVITVYVFWKLAAQITKEPSVQKWGTIIFAILTSLPIFEGKTPNAELFMILPTILAIYLCLKRGNGLNYFLAGVCVSLATLFKVPAFFDSFIVFIILLFSFSPKTLKQTLFKGILFIVGALIPILITFIWYYSKGAFKEYLIAAFLQNFGYVASWRTGSINSQASFLVKNGPILLRALVLAFTGLIALVFQKKLKRSFAIVLVWMLSSLFAATLSERPYPHYLIQSLPAAAILFAMLFRSKTYSQALSVFPLLIMFAVPVYYKFWQYKSNTYFSNFQKLVVERDYKKYINLFGGNTKINYEIASYVKGVVKNTDKIFIWGDGTSIYALTNSTPPIKYVAGYHINDYSTPKEVVESLSLNLPKLIIIMPNEIAPRELLDLLNDHYFPIGINFGASFWYNRKT